MRLCDDFCVSVCGIVLLLVTVVGLSAAEPFEVVSGAKQPSVKYLAKGSSTARNVQKIAAKTLPLEIKLKKSGIVFRLIPVGSFRMGSPKTELSMVKDKDAGRNPEEKQVAKTIEKPYFIGKFELSQAAWEAVLKATPGSVRQRYNPHKLAKLKYDPSSTKGGGHPVDKINYYEVEKWISMLEKWEGLEPGTIRLPTNTEWEFACRAGTKTMYYTGNKMDDVQKAGWIDKNSGKKLQPSGKKWPNAFGLYDMLGNATEMMHYVPGEIEKISPSFMKYITGIKKPEKVGTFTRGGSFGDYFGHCRSAVRHWTLKISRQAGTGFRLAIPDAEKLIGKTFSVEPPKKEAAENKSRTWTIISGKTLEGVMYQVKGEYVFLKLKSNKKVKIKKKNLSKEDLNYIKDYK